MSRIFDLGYMVEGFAYQKERKIFKRFLYGRTTQLMSERNDGGNEKKSFELWTWCLQWVMLRWLTRIISFKDADYEGDAWTKGQFFLGSYTSWCR